MVFRQAFFPQSLSAFSSWRAILPFPYLHQEWSELIPRWIAKSETIKPAYDMYLASHYNPHLYIENQLLFLTQAVETFHRRKYGDTGKYQTDKVFREGLYLRFLEVIPDDLDSSFEKSLKDGKLWYANDFSLLARMTKLTKNLSDYVKVGFLGQPRRVQKDELEKIKDARNHLVHHGVDSTFKQQFPIGKLVEWKTHLEFILVVALFHVEKFPMRSQLNC